MLDALRTVLDDPFLCPHAFRFLDTRTTLCFAVTSKAAAHQFGRAVAKVRFKLALVELYARHNATQPAPWLAAWWLEQLRIHNGTCLRIGGVAQARDFVGALCVCRILAVQRRVALPRRMGWLLLTDSTLRVPHEVWYYVVFSGWGEKWNEWTPHVEPLDLDTCSKLYWYIAPDPYFGGWTIRRSVHREPGWFPCTTVIAQLLCVTRDPVDLEWGVST